MTQPPADTGGSDAHGMAGVNAEVAAVIGEEAVAPTTGDNMSKGNLGEEIDTVNESEKLRAASKDFAKKCPIERHLDRQKKAREAKMKGMTIRISAVRNDAWQNPYAVGSEQGVDSSRSRRPVSPMPTKGDRSVSPRSAGAGGSRSSTQARSSTPTQAMERTPMQAARSNTPKRELADRPLQDGNYSARSSVQRSSPRRATQKNSPRQSPRSEGRGTKNSRLPGDVLARIKEAQQHQARQTSGLLAEAEEFANRVRVLETQKGNDVRESSPSGIARLEQLTATVEQMTTERAALEEELRQLGI